MEEFIANISKQNPLSEFDETLWGTLLESITVYSKKDMRVKFKDWTHYFCGTLLFGGVPIFLYVHSFRLLMHPKCTQDLSQVHQKSICIYEGGKINLIITKSVSRFARNTVDSLSTIRKLKEHNVECYFEKENIWSFDPKCDIFTAYWIQTNERVISEIALFSGFLRDYLLLCCYSVVKEWLGEW